MKYIYFTLLLSVVPLLGMDNKFPFGPLHEAIGGQDAVRVKELLSTQAKPSFQGLQSAISFAENMYDKTTLHRPLKNPLIKLGGGLIYGGLLGLAALDESGESKKALVLGLALSPLAGYKFLDGALTLSDAARESWSLYHNTTPEQRAEKQQTAQTILDLLTAKQANGTR